MKHKKTYQPAALSVVSMQGGIIALTGSITSTPVSASSKDVSVNSFQEDKEFKDNGFGDISF